jgi:two-component system, cell cycle response regulator
MTARILVTDDNPANRKLLEARLTAEYYEVLTASNGERAIEIAEEGLCDIILLDVMMPGMDGFEVCRRLRSSARTMHLPIVMVTALDQPADRVKGLSAGADDFLTKPIDEAQLIARVRSLARLKVAIDELRRRVSTAAPIEDSGDAPAYEEDAPLGRGRLLMVEDRKSSAERLALALEDQFDVFTEADAREAMFKATEEDFDLVVVSLGLADFDPLRLCSHIRALERTRHLPVLIIADLDDRARVLRGLELGVNDWLSRPVDRNELLARARTQLRQKRYAERLREQVDQSLELALVDPLTGLNNRRFMETHLPGLIKTVERRGEPLSMLIFDIDNFKRINDSHGHAAGDDVLKGFADRLRAIVRGGDMLCRLGGEEFVMLMPGVDLAFAAGIAERARKAIEDVPFPVLNRGKAVPVTVSIGVAERHENQAPAEIYYRADQALYRAKSEGRNRVAIAA